MGGGETRAGPAVPEAPAHQTARNSYPSEDTAGCNEVRADFGPGRTAAAVVLHGSAFPLRCADGKDAVGISRCCQRAWTGALVAGALDDNQAERPCLVTSDRLARSAVANRACPPRAVGNVSAVFDGMLDGERTVETITPEK